MEMLLVNIIHYIYTFNTYTLFCYRYKIQNGTEVVQCTQWTLIYTYYRGEFYRKKRGRGYNSRGGSDPATLPPPNLPLICPKFLFLFFIYNEILTLGYRINTHSHLKVIYIYLDLLMFRLNFQFQFQYSGSLTPGSDLLISCYLSLRLNTQFTN